MNIASEQGMDQMTCHDPVLCDYVQNATCTGKIRDRLWSSFALHFFSHGYNSSSWGWVSLSGLLALLRASEFSADSKKKTIKQWNNVNLEQQLWVGSV